MNNFTEHVLRNYIRNIKEYNDIYNFISNDHILEEILRNEVNGIPLIFLFARMYNQAIDLFIADENHIYPLESKKLLETSLPELKDKFGNSYKSYRYKYTDAQNSSLFESFSCHDFIHSEMESTEGYIPRVIKAELATKHILENTLEPQNYSLKYMQSHIKDIRSCGIALNNSNGVIALKYLFGSTQEDSEKTFSLINKIPVLHTNFQKIIDDFKIFYPDNKDDNISDILLNVAMVEVPENMFNVDNKLKENLFSYVVHDLYSYCKSEDGDKFIFEKTRSITSANAYIDSFTDIKLAKKFKSCMDDMMKVGILMDCEELLKIIDSLGKKIKNLEIAQLNFKSNNPTKNKGFSKSRKTIY